MTRGLPRLLAGILFTTLALLSSSAFANDVGVVKISKGTAAIERA